MRRTAQVLLFPIGILLILVLTLLVFRLPLVESLKLLASGAFGDKFGWSRTLVKTSPMLITGLGMVIAWKGGIYNIGGEGQYIVGGICGAALAKILVFGGVALPPWLVIPLILMACIIGGMIWAFVAGLLYVKRGVEVVISTILLNFVAIQLLSYLVSGPLQEKKKQVPLTDSLPDGMMLPKLSRQMDLHAGVLIALIVAGIVYLFLFRSNAGYQIRLVGESIRMARANRLNVNRSKLSAIVLSGGLCGMAGGIEYLGMSGQLGTGFSQQWGFLGIPVALLGGLHPLWCILSALLFGALFAGSENLARFTTSGSALVYVIQAITVLTYVSYRAYMDRRPYLEAS